MKFVNRIRPQHVVDSALHCSAEGMPDAENAAKHGVAVKTILDELIGLKS